MCLHAGIYCDLDWHHDAVCNFWSTSSNKQNCKYNDYLQTCLPNTFALLPHCISVIIYYIILLYLFCQQFTNCEIFNSIIVGVLSVTIFILFYFSCLPLLRCMGLLLDSLSSGISDFLALDKQIVLPQTHTICWGNVAVFSCSNWAVFREYCTRVYTM